MRLRQRCQENMEVTLRPSGVTRDFEHTPVYINKKFKIENPSDHSLRKSSCLLKKCGVTALLVNLITNVLESMKKEVQIKPRLIPYSVETVSSLESMPYPHVPSCRIRGRKARPRCMLCPGAQHSTCIPRRRVISMSPPNACCKVGKCYNPCLPLPPNFCPFHGQGPCPVRPCTPRPTTTVKSKFPPKRESYMHMPCNTLPCNKKIQGGGCISVTAIQPPCCPRPIPCLAPVPSCYDCPTFSPCQPQSKPRAKPKLSRPNLCKRLCVLNPKKKSNTCLDCSAQCTTTVATEETYVQVQRFPSCHRPCIQPCAIPCPRPQKFCTQQEVNTDNMKYCISTQTSVCVFPEVRCGPSHCCASQPKVAQTGPSRLNIAQSGPSYQICPRRSQVQFNQAVQIQSENFQCWTEAGSKNCACQASCDPIVLSNVCQPLANGVFIRFPDNMVSNGVYGVSMPTVVTQSGAGPYPVGGAPGNGGAMQDRRTSAQEPIRRQWEQPSTPEVAVPTHKKPSGTGPMHYTPSAAPTNQLPPSPQDQRSHGQGSPRISGDFQVIPPRHSDTFGPWNAQPYDSPNSRNGNQGMNGSLGLRFEGKARSNEPQTLAPRDPYASGYDSRQQPDAVRGAYGPQSTYTGGIGQGNVSSTYGDTTNCVYPPPLDPGIAASNPYSTGINYPYGQQSGPGYGPQSHGIPNPAYGQPSPTDAYDPRLIMPGGATKTYGPEGSLSPYDSPTRTAGQVRPNFTYDTQSGVYGQNGRPHSQYPMEDRGPINAYGQSQNLAGSSDQYGPQLMSPVSTKVTPRTSATFRPQSRFFGISENQTEIYDPAAAVTTAAQTRPYRPKPTGANGPSVSFNTSRPREQVGTDDPNELHGVYDPAIKSAIEESQVVLTEPDFNDASGQTEAPEPNERDPSRGQRRTPGHQLINNTLKRNNGGSKPSQTHKNICKPRRFYCTQDGQTKTKGNDHAVDADTVDADTVDAQFYDQNEEDFDDQDNSEIYPQRAKFTTGTGQQSVGQQQFSSQVDVECSCGPQASESRHYKPQEIAREALSKKPVTYDPHIKGKGDLQPGTNETIRSRSHKSASRRESVGQSDLAAVSNNSELSIPITNSSHSSRRRPAKGTTDVEDDLYGPKTIRKQSMGLNTDDKDLRQAVRVSSPKGPQRSVAITPFPFTTSDERIKPLPSSPPLSRSASTEGANVTIKKPTTPSSVKKVGRLSRGNTKSNPPRPLNEVPAKEATYHQVQRPDKSVQSRSASPQRKGSDQSRGTSKSVHSRSASPQRKASDQSRGSSKPVQSRLGSPHQSQGLTQTKSKRNTSVRPKSGKSKKAKGPVFDSKIDTSDDRVERDNLLYNRQTESLYTDQETGLQTSPSEIERPNFNMGTSVSQQRMPALQPTPVTKSSGYCNPCPGKRRASDLGDMMSCGETDCQQNREYSSGEEGDHGTSAESIASKSDSSEEVICKKLSEKRISIKSSGTDPPEDLGTCWSHRLGSPCRPFSRLYSHKYRVVSSSKPPCREEINVDCFTPPCHRKLSSRKRPRLILQNKPPWQNVNGGRNARRPVTSTAAQPLPPCLRIQPWPEPCPLRSKSPNSPTRICPFVSSSSPCRSPCRMSPKHSAIVKASCRCSNEENKNIECKEGQEEGFPCSTMPSLIAECQCSSKGTKDCKCKRFHISSSLQALRSRH